MKKELPTFEKDGFELENGVETNKLYSETFHIPSEKEKSELEKGNIVKLTFHIQTQDDKGEVKINPERMWVIIFERDGEWFEGILDNQPFCTDQINPGMQVIFKLENIININDLKVDLQDEKFLKYTKERDKLFKK